MVPSGKRVKVVTFDTLVQNVMDRLNLTSDTARNRIRGTINDVYRAMSSSIGLQIARRTTAEITVDPADVDYEDLPEITVNNMEKVSAVYRVVGTRKKRLDQVSYDDIIKLTTNDSIPTKWAVKRMYANYVIIVIDNYYTDDTFDLLIEGYEVTDELADDNEPAFPESFHDILVQGALADELLKMEKPQLTDIAANAYENRLSDLRMFIAKSAYQDIVQGKNKPAPMFHWFNKN